MSKKAVSLLLYSILVLGLIFRFYGINWDEGYHLHPDERAIVLSVVHVEFPRTIAEFFTKESGWNTHFFAYGSFPFYLLRIAGNTAGLLNEQYAQYDGIQLIGRFLSTLFDLGTIVILFFLGKKIKDARLGLLSAFVYATSVLPVQLSHFFAVDTILTFFTTLLLLLLLRFYEKPSFLRAATVGVTFGFSLATKVSALVLLIAIGVSIAVDFLLIFLKKPHKVSLWTPHLAPFLKRLLIDGALILAISLFTYSLLSPYTFIDFTEFKRQTLEQSQMTKNAFTFPFTFQYALKIPYLYEIKNIFLYGLGPITGVLSFTGFIFFVAQTIRKRNAPDLAKHVILLVFFLVYFGVVGNFSVGFMRYMLPLYPLFCLFGATTIYWVLFTFLHKKSLRVALCIFLSVLLLVWPLSFMHIYTATHTRITASEWMHSYIPKGKTIGLEHWDDGLPLYGIEDFNVITYPLYESDTPEKWELISSNLKQTDYLILASNRLYVPLPKLTDCKKLPPGRCYTRTALYYQSLFNGSLGFKKVAEFSSYPTLEIGKWKMEIRDDNADESFTVYDHPKIMIFKKQ